jgi:sensor histidine kinase YesM
MSNLFLVMQSFNEILSNPNDNGIVVFILGLLFILSVYHFLLYFQHKDKVYLYYSSYTFLIFLGHLDEPKVGFIADIVKPFIALLSDFNINITWSYNLLYFIFAFTFINLKLSLPKWHKFIFRSIYLLFFITLLIEILYQLTGDIQFIIKGDLVFIVSLSIIGFLSYIPLFKVKNPLKYYIIVGSTFLFGSSLTATFIFHLDLSPDGSEVSYSIFYIGVILENLLFSLGLGHKQKLILNERNESQKKLILQLQENEQLRQKSQVQLEIDVKNLSKQAEIEKSESLKSKYDKELAELKVSALRSQMNPHFIFNSLNSIKRYIIDNEKENAVYYLNKFSKLIRKILSASMGKEISLSEELETMELYVNIENIRFNNKIKFSIHIDETLNLNAIKVPSLILQPFLENAIWHGLSLKKEGKKLTIKVGTKSPDYLVIQITDNGIGRKRSAEIQSKKIHKRESVGIKLTEERFALFSKGYVNKHIIQFIDLIGENNNPTGTNVILKIPLT